MKCPFCKNGCCGINSATGEAIDCDACDGAGNVTPEIFRQSHEARMQQSGDLQAIYGMARDGMWADLKSILLEPRSRSINPGAAG